MCAHFMEMQCPSCVCKEEREKGERVLFVSIDPVAMISSRQSGFDVLNPSEFISQPALMSGNIVIESSRCTDRLCGRMYVCSVREERKRVMYLPQRRAEMR